MPQIKIHLIGRMRENEFVARAARNLEHIRAILCQLQQLEIITFEPMILNYML